ncbi:HAMP domain-containing histidine kinase [Aliifodinibius sp. S!AR15-10]|uniref:sensor histidine kinase n=1 Tax=Aliifodinibius sp. S!AR15-10 TaxID=2950437 RepID=UPI0028576613|nr:HAMP domain-containing sensor histidine kinase [Aliifodinibius sp. S!AR15-10]MDR8394108.1 HAMP domain-containing histidine kinase [Aliifodinibius sp. S!AR15-10]
MEEKNAFYKYSSYLLAVAGGLILCLLLLEGWLYYIKPYPVTEESGYVSSLQEAVNIYNNQHDELLDNSQDLAERLEAQLQGGGSRQNLYPYIQQYPSLWGVTLFKNVTPQAWSGFSFSSYPKELIPSSIGPETYVDVIKQNNVISFLCRIQFSIEDSSGAQEYELFTTSRIEQENALPIGQSHEFDLLAGQQESLQYPAELSFFEVFPDSALGFRVLSTQSRDSVGVAFIPPGRYGQTVDQWNEKASFWRSLFSLLAYLSIMFLLYAWLGTKNSWQSLFIQLIIVGVAWFLFSYMQIPERWIPGFWSGSPSAQLSISILARNSLFVFFIADTIARFLRKRKVRTNHSNFLRTMSAAGVFGLLSSGIITFAIGASYDLLTTANLSLFDLQIFPSSSTFFLYLTLALLLFSVGYALYSINTFLLKSESDPYKLVLIISSTSFFIGLIFLQLYLPDWLTLNWATWISGVFFVGISAVATLKARFPYTFSSFSVIRAVTVSSFLIAIIGYPVLKNAQFVRMDNELLQHARGFQVREDSIAQQATREMLVTLEKQFRGTTQQALNERVPFLQSRFNQTIEQSLTPQLRTYSFNLQLIKPSGDVVADYSTDLNAPNWTNFYDLSYLSAATDIERITKNSNRPIIQLPQLENSARYDTFYRGWIPIFSSESDQQIAWILCSVYREHPDFDKPIRAVLASLTYADWDESFLLMEYQDGELVRSSKGGLAGHFPRYNTLRTAEKEALSADSVLFYSTNEFQQNYRNVLVEVGQDSVIKASTIYPNTKNELFAFFRFSFSLFLAGMVIIPFYLLLTRGKSAFQGSHQRFEHRILDNFLTATLLFLGLLIATTHLAIHTQNKEIVRQDLYDKLDKLARDTENDPQFIKSLNSNAPFTMQPLVAPLNVDAAYFKNRLLQESTTPQIYQQHLLPSTLPFDVYNDLYIQQKSQVTGMVRLASQNLLIGYQSLLSPQGQPVGAVAIPTFMESPKYDQQLLETTSYLIVFYLFTFGIFIAATTFIAKRITVPLRSIQEGLNKISEGKLDTKIPVKSDDEIASLARAYNGMVERLKEVRQELAIAEREAAWKEMAQQVAHEIKNPLTPMKLNVQHLERQLSNGTQDLETLTSNIKKITRNLTEQIQTLNNIASDFSKFSKPINEEFTKVDVNVILHSVAELYQQDQGTQLQTDLTEYSINVNGVSDELRRVFINLVKNAFEAMPENGGTIKIKSYIKEGSAFFAVEDDGTGISEEDKSKIFVPNFSTKSSGTGLGLAISKKIIEAHNGSITFASIEGKGTTFVIKMPLWSSQS